MTIGVFDSGMGGLTVLRALQRRLPQERFIYLGDTARLPYGTKSPATVARYAVRLGEHLIERGVDLLVVACNTVSAVALEAVAELGVPVVGVITAGARAAVASGGPIGVLGTEATIESGAYVRAIMALDANIAVHARACPLFVPLVEEGWTEGEVPRTVAERYLGDLGPVRTLLLGCTHYPLLQGVLQQAAPGVAIVDAAQAVADDVVAATGLVGSDTAGNASASTGYLVTDGAARFVALGGRIMGHDLANVELIDV
jgi:glutamate racemase